MQPLDLIILFFLAYAAYGGYRKGLVVELINTIGLVLAVAAGFMLLDMTTDLLGSYLKSSGPMLPFIAFFVVFIAVVWSVRQLAQIARKTIRYTLLGTFDTTAGAALGMLKITFTISTILWIIGLVGIGIPAKYTRNTHIYPVVAKIGPGSIKLFGTFMPFLKDLPESVRKLGKGGK